MVLLQGLGCFVRLEKWVVGSKTKEVLRGKKQQQPQREQE